MNKALSFLRRSLIPVLLVVSTGVLLSSCLKDKDGNNPDIPAGALMSFNLAPDQPGLLIRLSGNLLTQTPLAYTNYSGAYQSIYAGNRQIDAFNVNNNKQISASSFNFETGKYYSLFITGADSAYRNIVAVDNFDSLSAADGKAYVRYINAITDSVNAPTVTIAAGGNNVVNEPAPYTRVSEFTAINPGSISIAVKNNNGVDASRTISVEQKKIYTILLVGKPGAADANQQVQIKFIGNGTLSDDNK
ncbi:DUF4397 domain-containing protein [Paraflavitalea sp. CAU 1676]|uniref:DUF4397 domain-containing protein n=1 Tax=Paraflavitalea sp. CAU 1676 TaxID=3032598 RepID=UPI0023DBCD69|nr:DUF4397 domain-containing protein [Paraflavitalea sp. CAU 1676]MDF2193263.1 DUF4397 domain-containing protein [Paraflavitalea sp. CAU 1676]